MTKINIGLNDIDKVVDSLKELYNNVKKMEKDIPKELVDVGLKYLNNQYKNTPFDYNLTDINTTKRHIKDGYSIISYGKDVVYAEFGTGDEGEKHDHKNKESRYGLKDYNSGPYIRDVDSVDKDSYTGEDLAKIGITSGKFWYYTRDGFGHYTQGIPAGKQMFNTFNYLRDESKKIIGKRGKELNDKFIKSIKK